MNDPFQSQRRPAPPRPAHQAMGPLRDTSPDAKFVRSRSKGFLRAVELLDALTAGDESLYASLSSQAAEYTRPAPDPFATKRGAAKSDGEEALLDAMLQAPPPPPETQAFQERKEELNRQCQKIIRAESARQEDKVVYLASCSIPFHLIHWIDEEGNVLRHYRPQDLDTPLLQMAAELLSGEYFLVEIHGSFPDASPGTVLYAARKSGSVEKVTF